MIWIIALIILIVIINVIAFSLDSWEHGTLKLVLFAVALIFIIVNLTVSFEFTDNHKTQKELIEKASYYKDFQPTIEEIKYFDNPDKLKQGEFKIELYEKDFKKQYWFTLDYIDVEKIKIGKLVPKE